MSVSIRDLWVNFLPRGLSLPPAPPPPPSCNSALVAGLTSGDIYAEDFCSSQFGPYTSKADFLAAVAAFIAANAGSTYGTDLQFNDWVVIDDGNPSAFVFGQGDPWNGGHAYLEQVFPAGPSQILGIGFDVTNKLGASPWSNWRMTGASGPTGSWQRLVCKFSSGYYIHEYYQGGADFTLLGCYGVPYWDPATSISYTPSVLELRIVRDSTDTWGADGKPHLLLSMGGGFNYNAGIQFDLGNAETLVFDGNVHTWELYTSRAGAAGFGDQSSLDVTVVRDGVVLTSGRFDDWRSWTLSTKRDYMPYVFRFFGAESYPNGWNAGGGIDLPASQSWRLYEIEAAIVGMPTVGP